MDDTTRVLQEHVSLTRRYFLKLGGVASAVLSLPAFRALSAEEPGTLAEVISALEYLTRPEDFGTVERGDPLPYKLPKEKRLEVGLERACWSPRLMPRSSPSSSSRASSRRRRTSG